MAARWKICFGHLLSGALVLANVDRPAAQLIEVDVELVLAVDVSLSMDQVEQRMQRNGYISALQAPDVIASIRGGLLGRVAIAYLQWGGETDQEVVVDWTIIDGLESARHFAEKVSRAPFKRTHRTAIGAALLFAAGMITDNRFAGLRRIIDISGDGANNQGVGIVIARQKVADLGIVVNGLPIALGAMKRAWPNWFDNRSVADYYRQCVITGPGAFVLPVESPDMFAESIRRKLIAEIANPVPTLRQLFRTASGPYELCEIGEFMWRRGEL